MVNFKDFTKSGSTDWKSYKNAQIESGEICCQCGRYIALNKDSGKKTLCSSCKTLNDSSESTVHDGLIRCPKCHGTFEPSTFSEYDIYEDGEHDLDCPSCGYFFVVDTTVNYLFESPSMADIVADKEEDGDYDNTE